jgi:hypothetical protein
LNSYYPSLPSFPSPLFFILPSFPSPLFFILPSFPSPLFFILPSLLSPLFFILPSLLSPLFFILPSFPSPLFFILPSFPSPLSSQLFHTRYTLHKRVYHHPVSDAVDLMVAEAMVLADPYLLIPGTYSTAHLPPLSTSPSPTASPKPLDILLLSLPHPYPPYIPSSIPTPSLPSGQHNRPTRMSESVGDMHAYWRLGEYLLKSIEHSFDPVRATASDRNSTYCNDSPSSSSPSHTILPTSVLQLTSLSFTLHILLSSPSIN